MNQTKLELYKEMFDFIAKGKSSFGHKELGDVMQSYGMKSSEAEIQDMMSQLELNASGECEFQGFVNFLSQKIRHEEAEEELREALSIFDLEGNEFIRPKDFREAMNNLGEHLSHEEIDEFLREVNCEAEDQEVNIEEFVSMLLSTN